MDSSAARPAAPGPWTSLRVVALLSLLAQLALCQFFSFGQKVPTTIDVNPSNLWRSAWHFPPAGEFLVVNWLGVSALPSPANPFSLAAHLAPWLFFTAYTPVMSTLALLSMAALLRELELSRPAALFGALVYAWQGDILPFVFPGHFGYIGTWVFYALGAWAALRSVRTGYWAYAVIAGACCGLMVGLQPDRGGMASLVIAAIYLAAAGRNRATARRPMIHLALCTVVAAAVALAALLALFQSYIIGVSMGGKATGKEETYKFDTQFSLGPAETLTYLAPGFFGWHSSSPDGPYWGEIGEWYDWASKHEGTRNLNLAISTTGTVATALALFGGLLVLRGRDERWPGPSLLRERPIFYGRLLLVLGAAGLILAWGYHTPLYRAVFALPLMDKWRDPLKWLQWTNFSVVILSAYGAEQMGATLSGVETPERTLRRRSVRIFADALLGLLFLGFLGSYAFTVTHLPVFQEQGYEAGEIAAIMSLIHFSLLMATGLMAGVCVLLRLLWRPDRLRGWTLPNPWLHRAWRAMLEPDRLPLTLVLGLGVLSVAQLAWVAEQFVRPMDLSLITEVNPLVEQLEDEGTAVRVSVAAHDPMLNTLLQNQLNTRRVSSLDISAASRYPDALSDYFSALASDPARLWFLSGVKNRALPQSEFDAIRTDPALASNIETVSGYLLEPTASPSLPSHVVVGFRDYMAKATVVPSAEIIPAASDELARLKDPKWNPRQTVLLATPAGTPAVGPISGNAVARLRVYTSHRIEVSVHTPASGYLLIDDAYDPDWIAEVNGTAAPVLRADFIFRAVPVPVGDSEVKMRYVAHYRVAGLALPVVAVNTACDTIMLGAWLVAGVALWRRRDDAIQGV